MLISLIKIANRLDSNGLYNEADIIDKIISLAQGSDYLIIYGEMVIFGSIRIDIRVSEVATGRILEAKSFQGKEAEAQQKRAEADAYIKQLQQKYPNSKVQKD